MIVVTIIGLLASLAIPAFNIVRSASTEKIMMNDGRLLGNACSQYFLEQGVITVSINDIIGNSNYVKSIADKSILLTNTDGFFSEGESFSMENELYGTIIFNYDGSVSEKQPGAITP
jgi:type II secretory pathway pseudopilin PulG